MPHTIYRTPRSISLFSDCAAAICGDGSVICQPFEAGAFSPGFQSELSQWRDTASLVSLSDCLLGLRRDGTVAYAGKRNGSDGSIREAVSGWSRVVGLYAAGEHAVVALCTDGTVRMAGENPYYSADALPFSCQLVRSGHCSLTLAQPAVS